MDFDYALGKENRLIIRYKPMYPTLKLLKKTDLSFTPLIASHDTKTRDLVLHRTTLKTGLILFGHRFWFCDD